MSLINPVEQHLTQFRQQNRSKTGSLIISCFGDAVLPRGGRIWLGSLIQLLKPLQLNDRLIRTSIFRLAQEEWMHAETVGRRADYMLTPAGQRRFEESARHIYAAHTPLWDRRWRLIMVVSDLSAKQRDRLRRALFWQGFGVAGSDCFVHPSADLTSALDGLRTDGMGEVLKFLVPMIAADAGSEASARDIDMVQRAWNLNQLGASYVEFSKHYRPILESLRHEGLNTLSDENAFLMRILLIHDYRRLLLRDPELPDVLLPRNWPGHQAREMCKEIYLRLLTPSERHIDLNMKLADDTTPMVLPMLAQRFQNEDPLLGK